MNKLVGHWKLRGDCRDYSGNNHHGTNRGVTFDKGADGGGVFNGCDAWIEMPMHSFEAGRMASDDRALGPGWNHLAAVREGGRLKLYTNGRLAATSAPFGPADYDLTIRQPLRIGFGQTDYFRGRIADVRLYKGALPETEVKQLAARRVR